MHRRLIYTLAIALILSLVSADAIAGKKSRSGRKQARAASSKAKRAKSSSSRVAKRGKGRREVARRGRRGRGRERIAGRSRRRRHEARSQPVISQDDSQASDAPPAPRSIASGIPPQRVTEIQQALIKHGYLIGPASGLYDENTSQAMKQFQAANKLPTTGLPSAHTLKRLGVAKRSNDGYAVSVKSVSDSEKKPQ
ncbi:MAG TPA: peptidoglycan-binding domain-containing protein [Blastocatellia bacterium]|nr:peptidoglycan-binding domain-containing protein [Blastocatellia bacterium]